MACGCSSTSLHTSRVHGAPNHMLLFQELRSLAGCRKCRSGCQGPEHSADVSRNFEECWGRFGGCGSVEVSPGVLVFLKVMSLQHLPTPNPETTEGNFGWQQLRSSLDPCWGGTLVSVGIVSYHQGRFRSLRYSVRYMQALFEASLQVSRQDLHMLFQGLRQSAVLIPRLLHPPS